MYHPDEQPEFEYERGDAFRLADEAEPDEYYVITARLWNYDAKWKDSAWGPEMACRQYEIGEVSSLGGNPQLVSEADLKQHYEQVDKETAKEVL